MNRHYVDYNLVPASYVAMTDPAKTPSQIAAELEASRKKAKAEAAEAYAKMTPPAGAKPRDPAYQPEGFGYAHVDHRGHQGEVIEGRPDPAAAATPAAMQLPRIGEQWQGGTYIGVCRGRDGAPDYHLILSDAKPDNRLDLGAAMAWAGAITANGFSDWTLPTRAESAVLFGNAADHFEEAWYWTSEVDEDDGSCAWFQGFYDGCQFSSPQGYELRARAVRRLPLQSFDPSTPAA